MTTVPSSPDPDPEAPVSCPNCGWAGPLRETTAVNGARHCPKCGAPVVTGAPDPEDDG
jgi:hypothetical protein